ncbi:41355_t:CDS:2 [Gigaspora margarita]|uniref:41355_t:CDS:1 n=1 Tax=Gigaspora margarita TaxID=4874 RepID=A0ABN7UDU6_GIGMA|nr:41355_t:CDS:2 [Gigaspora margarita]
MLLWELTFEKIPYEDLNMNKIMKIVKNGDCERITIGKATLGHQRIQKTSLTCDQLYYQTSLYLDGYFDLDRSKSSEVSLMKLLEDGIAYHKNKDYETTWNIFEYHAELGSSTAKFWQGHYLADGIFVKKDIVQAAELFKEAAGDNNIDTCFRYALLITDKTADAKNAMAQYNLGDMHLKEKLSSYSNADLGINYLKLAALNGHSEAEAVLKEKHIEINE